MKGKFTRAFFLQFSTIMGAGIFALPYFLYHSNFWWAILGMFLVAIITAIVNGFYIQVICYTDGDQQLPGYAQKYLGEKFRYLATISLIISGVGALLTYIKLGSKFLQILLSINGFFGVVIFLLLIISGYLLKIKKIKIILDYLPFLSIVIIFLLLKIVLSTPLPNIEVQNFNLAFFGVTVFALSGFTIIPEMEEVLRGEKNKKIKLVTASNVGLLLAFVAYVIFSYSIIKLVGNNLTEDSVEGLVKVSKLMAGVVSLLGLLITFKGSINFMKVFHEIFYRDFKIKETYSKILTVGLPIISLGLFNLSLGSILGVIGAGSVFLVTIIICLMRLKIKNSYWTLILVVLVLLVFATGLAFAI